MDGFNAVHVETRRKITVKRRDELLSHAAGVVLMQRRKSGQLIVILKEDEAVPGIRGMHLRGRCSYPARKRQLRPMIREDAALNSVQIAEILVKNYL